MESELMTTQEPHVTVKATPMSLRDFILQAGRFRGSVPITFQPGPGVTRSEVHEAFQKAAGDDTAMGEVDENQTTFTLRWKADGVEKWAMLQSLPNPDQMEAFSAPKIDMEVFTLQRVRHEEANLMLEEIDRKKNWKPWNQPGQRMTRHNDRHHYRPSKGGRR